MTGTKVFVGNLSFKTSEAGLAEEFSKAGKVVSANIITRGSRSLGYGFVEMENEETAQKAVQLLNKKELDGRPINVEVANIRDATQVSEKDQESPDQADHDARSPRGRGRGGIRGGRGSPRGVPNSVPRGGAPRGAPRSRGPFRGAPRGSTSPGRGGLPRRSRDDLQDRTPSKTSLFIANIPFSYDDAALSKLVTDTVSGIQCKFARVVTMQSGRSKGFGFVEVENEEAQTKALDALNDKEVDGRKLVVKIALTEPTKDKTTTTTTTTSTTEEQQS